jgi:hypothetical protein
VAGEVAGKLVVVMASYPLMMTGAVWSEDFEGLVLSSLFVVAVGAIICKS